MPVTTDIVQTYRRPRVVMRRLLNMGQREDRALIFLMGGCFMVFISQWPAMARAAHLFPEVPLEARVGATLVAWLFAMPIVFYGLAALGHLVARAFGGRGTWFSARLALFWTLLATAPVILFRGLIAGFIGAGPGLTLADTMVTLVFFALWFITLKEAEQG